MKVILWVWFLVVATDGIGAAIAAARLWRARRESKACQFVSMLLAGFAIESFIAVIALAVGPPPAVVVGRLVMNIVGRSIKAACGWTFTLYLLGVLLPDGSESVDTMVETAKKNGNGHDEPQ